ncbi:MAG: precorrin-6A reductase [Ruminococcus sp.]|nr:precorrin-6A reductase [Ruminococcus sp.]
MFRAVIFGGTTEGRLLGEFCEREGISAVNCVATAEGAKVLPEGCRVLVGRLTSSQMEELFESEGCTLAVDATHPYALEVTKNIRSACERAGVRYVRLIRERGPVYGESAGSMEEMRQMLDLCEDRVLSTLGSKEAGELSKVRNAGERIWLRVLPGEEVRRHCEELGFDPEKIIQAKGPFTEKQNMEDLIKSGAGILLTKESGAAGGYPEKIRAAMAQGVRVIGLKGPQEEGMSLAQVQDLLAGQDK